MLKSWIPLLLVLNCSFTLFGQDAVENIKLNNLVNSLPNKKINSDPNKDIVGSIIQYKDKAVLPLTNFIDSCKEIKSKNLAVYTLYLIGIESLVPYSGGYYNHFINKGARIVLLHCLYDKSICNAVLEQLIEDPWITDIPVFMEYLSKPNVDYIKELNALKSYSFDGGPLIQKVPKEIAEMSIEVNGIETNFLDDNINNPIISLVNLKDPKIVIDDEILKSQEWLTAEDAYKQQSNHKHEENLKYIVQHNNHNSEYTENKYFFCFANNKMTVYGPNKACEIWLNWWQNLSKKEKAKFYDEKNPSLFSHPR